MTPFEIVHQPLYASNKKFLPSFAFFCQLQPQQPRHLQHVRHLRQISSPQPPWESTRVPPYRPSKHSQLQQKQIHYLRTKISATDVSQNLRERCLIFAMHKYRRATNDKWEIE